MSTTTSPAHKRRFGLRAFPALSLLASVTACSALAGCGSSPPPPALSQADAQRLIALAHRVETTKAPCTQQREISRLRTAASSLLNSGRVPQPLAESLSSGVNALVADEPSCLPTLTAQAATTAPAPTPAPAPAPAPAPPRPHDHGHGPPPGHDHGHGHGDHGHGHGHGDGGDG